MWKEMHIDLTFMYFCQLCICPKLHVHDSEGSPSTMLGLPGGGNPIAYNEGQAARLMKCVSPRLPFLPCSNAGLVQALN